MRTACLLTVSRSIPCAGWICPFPLDTDPCHPGCSFPDADPLPTNADPPPPPVDRMTHACENITLPQTLFAGGNYNRIETFDQFSFYFITFHKVFVRF